MRFPLFSLMLLLDGCAAGPWQDAWGEEQNASIPRDVRRWVIDAQACGHWSGEEPFDAERAAAIESATSKHCPRLAERRLILRKRHSRNAEALSLIEKAWSIFE